MLACSLSVQIGPPLSVRTILQKCAVARGQISPTDHRMNSTGIPDPRKQKNRKMLVHKRKKSMVIADRKNLIMHSIGIQHRPNIRNGFAVVRKDASLGS